MTQHRLLPRRTPQGNAIDGPPTISIVLSTFNGARVLEPQLQSLSDQTLKPFEVIVRDDGSSDDTLEIVRSFQRSSGLNVELIEGQNVGFPDSFLLAAGCAAGDYIAFCDQDDVWRSDKLEVCSTLLQRYNPLLLAHGSEVVDSTGKPFPPYLIRPARHRKLLQRWRLPSHWLHLGCCVLAHRDLVLPLAALASVCPIREQSWKDGHDTIVCRLANYVGGLLLTPDPLVRWIRHESSLSMILPPKPRAKELAEGLARPPSLDPVPRYLTWLEQCPVQEQTAVFQRVLQSMRAYLSMLEAPLAERSRLYESSMGLRGLPIVAKLVWRGAYRSPSKFGFGIRALGKDLAQILLTGSKGRA